MGKMDTSELNERLFDEKAVFYNIANRNKIISEYQERAGKSKKEINKVQLEEQVAKESIEENNFVENVAAEQKQELDELTSLNIRNEFKQMLKKYNIDAKTAIDKIVVDLMKERSEEVSEE
jgi:hypothetical protein